MVCTGILCRDGVHIARGLIRTDACTPYTPYTISLLVESL